MPPSIAFCAWIRLSCGLVQLIGEKLEGLEADFADAGAAAGQWIDITDLHGLLRHRRAAEYRQRNGRNEG
jgi:hypothetical protein